MIAFPNAKINIGLHVLEKRADGFHNIETVFYPVLWCDILEVIIDEKASLRKKNPDLLFKSTGLSTYSPTEKNLCVRAYRLLKNDFPLKPVRVYLHKIIPIGAGLGGGSSDAAFAIKLLDKAFTLNLKKEQLLKYAASLGSDCSFFIENKPVIATGRGEKMKSIQLDLSNYYIYLIKPDFHISTAEAYGSITPAIPKQSLSKLISGPVETWRHSIKNDFEESAFRKFDELRSIKEKLYSHGALYASMSGSGSTMYGIFKEHKNLKTVFPDYVIWNGKLNLA